MERVMTKESLKENLETIAKIQKEIRKFTPIVSEELKSFSDSDYMSRVCNNSIDYKIRTAKEGDFLFQCCHLYNKRYFDRINRQKIPAGLIEEKAGVEVNVAGLSKFITDCPHAGEFLCKLRYYTEPVQGEDHKEKVKDL
jgi:hypothetical protein